MFGCISDQVAIVIDSRPFRLAIIDIEDSTRVKHVAARKVIISNCAGAVLGNWQRSPYLKVFPIFGRLEINQGWEEQDHVPSLVHDWCTAVSAADFAWQLVYGSLF